MTTNLTTGSDRSSATIYQFPPRGRYAVGARSPQHGSVTDRALPHMTAPAFGGAWYHDEAIRDERTRED
jgi:hypothetical protein